LNSQQSCIYFFCLIFAEDIIAAMNLIRQTKWGIWLSGLCAIHCLLTPIIMVSLPLIGVKLFENHFLELLLVIISFVIAMSAAVNSYLKVHRNFNVILIIMAGFAFIASAHIIHSENLEVILSVCGSLLIITGLIRNQSLIKTCSHKTK
jgi:hypothetical protein